MRFSTTIIAASILGLCACGNADVPKMDAPKAKNEISAKTGGMADKAKDMAQITTKTKAVLIYADWCGSCKVLDPKIKSVQSAMGGMGKMPGLEFVTLDFTNKNEEAFFAQADAAGVGEAVKAYLDGTVKTGQLLLVDLDDQTVVSKITKTFEPAEMMTAIKEAIAAS